MVETNTTMQAFQPTNKFIVENGMLSFESKHMFEATCREIAIADRKAVDLWEKSTGIKTPASIFYAVILAEDSISTYYMNLSEKEQEYWRNQPQKHSAIYEEALLNKTIHLIPDGDGGEYFDINLYDKSIANLINLDGFVKIENQIYQYTEDAIKIIQDGNIEKIETIQNINHNFNGNGMIVSVFSDNKLKSTSDWDVVNWTQDMPFYQFDKNWKGSYQKRVKVWIDGHSEPYGTPSQIGCYEYLNCSFVLRAEAQTKNFWGNWVYGNYWPSLSFSADWYYDYRVFTNVTYGCGLYDNNNSYLPSGNRTSPINNENIGGVNNAFIELTPHGVWRASPVFFSRPISVHGTITWSLGPLSNQTYSF